MPVPNSKSSFQCSLHISLSICHVGLWFHTTFSYLPSSVLSYFFPFFVCVVASWTTLRTLSFSYLLGLHYDHKLLICFSVLFPFLCNLLYQTFNFRAHVWFSLRHPSSICHYCALKPVSAIESLEIYTLPHGIHCRSTQNGVYLYSDMSLFIITIQYTSEIIMIGYELHDRGSSPFKVTTQAGPADHTTPTERSLGALSGGSQSADAWSWPLKHYLVPQLKCMELHHNYFKYLHTAVLNAMKGNLYILPYYTIMWTLNASLHYVTKQTYIY
jgi:hypothetical protein